MPVIKVVIIIDIIIICVSIARTSVPVVFVSGIPSSLEEMVVLVIPKVAREVILLIVATIISSGALVFICFASAALLSWPRQALVGIRKALKSFLPPSLVRMIAAR
jgi:hypothetical protein